MIAMKDFAESVSKQLMEQAQNIEGRGFGTLLREWR